MPKKFHDPSIDESATRNAHPEGVVSGHPSADLLFNGADAAVQTIEMIPNEPSDDFLLQLLADGADRHIVAETLRRRDEPNATMVAELLLLIAEAVPKCHQAISCGQNAFYEYLQAQERQRMLLARPDFSTEDRANKGKLLEQEVECMRDASDRNQRAAYASLALADCIAFCPAIVNDLRFREPIDADTAEISALREQLSSWPANHKWEFSLIGGWPKSMLRRSNVNGTVRLVTVAQQKGLRTR